MPLGLLSHIPYNTFHTIYKKPQSEYKIQQEEIPTYYSREQQSKVQVNLCRSILKDEDISRLSFTLQVFENCSVP